MKIKAPGYRLLVKLKPEKEKTKGGIIIPNSINEKLQQVTSIADVIDVGPNCWHDCGGTEQWCKPGDTVTIVKYSGRHVTFELDEENRPVEDGNLFRMVNDKDVIGVYTNE